MNTKHELLKKLGFSDDYLNQLADYEKRNYQTFDIPDYDRKIFIENADCSEIIIDSAPPFNPVINISSPKM